MFQRIAVRLAIHILYAMDFSVAQRIQTRMGTHLDQMTVKVAKIEQISRAMAHLALPVQVRSKILFAALDQVKFNISWKTSKYEVHKIKLWISGACIDTDDGKIDKSNGGCWWYYRSPEASCGKHDDSDFKANSLCCACGGGKLGTPTLFLIF